MLTYAYAYRSATSIDAMSTSLPTCEKCEIRAPNVVGLIFSRKARGYAINRTGAHQSAMRTVRSSFCRAAPAAAIAAATQPGYDLDEIEVA